MKKTVLIIVIMLLLSLTVDSLGGDLGVQVIGGSNFQMEPLSLDDMKLEKTYTIPGYARITATSFSFNDVFVQYAQGKAGNNEHGGSNPGTVWYKSYGGCFNYILWQESGTDADFAAFYMDITNLQKEDVAYIPQITVKVVFDDDYVFNGWVRQFDYNYDTSRDSSTAEDRHYGTFIRAALDPADEESIGMMYTGHFMFGCTLPNEVVIGKEPLRMEINLGGNELIYNIRK